MNAFPKSATRVGALAVGILLIGTFAAEAAQSHTGRRAQCRVDAQNAYNHQIAVGCGSQEYLDQYGSVGGQPVCIAEAAQQLHDALERCGDEPERQAFNAGVRGVPPSLTDSGPSDGGNGGNGGGTGANLGGTFNPSMGSAPMSAGGGNIIY